MPVEYTILRSDFGILPVLVIRFLRFDFQFPRNFQYFLLSQFHEYYHALQDPLYLFPEHFPVLQDPPHLFPEHFPVLQDLN